MSNSTSKKKLFKILNYCGASLHHTSSIEIKIPNSLLYFSFHQYNEDFIHLLRDETIEIHAKPLCAMSVQYAIPINIIISENSTLDLVLKDLQDTDIAEFVDKKINIEHNNSKDMVELVQYLIFDILPQSVTLITK